MPLHEHEPWQIRESAQSPGGYYCAACGLPTTNRVPSMTIENETGTPVQSNPHRLEVELSGRDLGYNIFYSAVCDAPEGAPCRMWCDHPDCQEESRAHDHDSHALHDQGRCGAVESLNADPSMIPELYSGEPTQLRPGPIDIAMDCDGATWTYSEPAPPLTRDERAELEEYRRRDAAGKIEYAVEIDGTEDGSPGAIREGLALNEAIHIRNLGISRRFAPRIVMRIHPAAAEWTPVTGPVCASTCRHECPECHAGLGTHLTCDPRCYHHLPPAEE